MCTLFLNLLKLQIILLHIPLIFLSSNCSFTHNFFASFVKYIITCVSIFAKSTDLYTFKDIMIFCARFYKIYRQLTFLEHFY